MNKLFTAAMCLCTIAASTQAAVITLDFDESYAINLYETTLGIEISDNGTVWGHPSPTVLVTPDGGAYTGHYALQFGNAGGQLGTIDFNAPINAISVVALSGPGSDNLVDGSYIKAYDAAGTLIGQDFVDTSLQFDFLSITGADIVKIELYSPLVQSDIWDHLVYTTQPISNEPDDGGEGDDGSEGGNGDGGSGEPGGDDGTPNVPEPASAVLLLVGSALLVQKP